eukprot:CAMPEP_0182902106 /NCGR_PEP_ID=MMETSP0034_2-20130328/30205_1 /TAXON_ID=156128 /ORGANISM="Nephroselmis pyriformis, Strain CCMP717" /LENGTH=175 /DNA_ID=CAMNT_0025036689 /DNA_START=204 /DNA_END=727 /DNA_ORIENTATION=-
MRAIRPAFLAAALLAACLPHHPAQACTKEEYAAQFGAPYVLESGGGSDPAIEDGRLAVTVTYESPCPGGGSEFTATFKDHEGMHILLASRAEPTCERALFAPAPVTARVSMDLPGEAKELMHIAPGGTRYIAFPPDGDYELMVLEERGAPPSDCGGERGERNESGVGPGPAAGGG